MYILIVLLTLGCVILVLLTKLVYNFLWKERSIYNQTVVITGSAQGIGRALCKKLVKENCHLACIDYDEIQNKITVEDLQKINSAVTIKAYKCDVSKSDDVHAIAKVIKDDFGCVDILINNAGIAHTGLLLDFPEEYIKKTIDINTMAHFWTTRAFLPDMLERNHGVIVALASVAGKFGFSSLIPYVTSKFAVVGFMESLRMELAVTKSNVKCLCVCPSIIKTQMTDCSKEMPFFVVKKEPDEVANLIIEAIKKEKSTIFIPRFYSLLYKGFIIFPNAISWFLTLVSSEDFIRNKVEMKNK